MESNDTNRQACPDSYDAGIGEKVGRTLTLSLLMSLALVGNFLVILVFKRNPATRTKMNYFVLNMAASDMLYPIFLLPRQMVYTWLGFRRFLVGGAVGQFLCKFSPLAVDMSRAVSIQSLVLIAAERYITVVHPLKSKSIFRPRSRAILISVMWAAATLLHAPHWYIYKLETRCDTLYCVKNWAPWLDSDSSNEVYDKIHSTFLVYIPFPLIAILYTFLSVNLLKKRNAPGSQATRVQDARRQERNKRITKMSACIVIAFAVCWLPLTVYITIRPHIGEIPNRLVLLYVLLHLAWANSAVNPWILFYFCENFRCGLVRDICQCCGHFSTESNTAVSTARDIELQGVGKDAQREV